MKCTLKVSNLGILCILTFGCAPGNRITLKDNSIQTSKYTATTPGDNWKLNSRTLFHRGETIDTTFDVIFVKECPGPQTIGIIEMNYITTHRNERHIPDAIDRKSFGSWALHALNETYDRKSNRPTSKQIRDYKSITINDHDAIAVVFETKEKFFNDCQLINESERLLLSKFVMINRSYWNESISLLNAGPKMIVLYYVSPEENYSDGIDEFERIVDTFHLK